MCQTCKVHPMHMQVTAGHDKAKKIQVSDETWKYKPCCLYSPIVILNLPVGDTDRRMR